MRIALLAAIILLFSSCKKEPTTWDADLSLPLVQTELGIDDLFPDSLIDVNEENQSVSLVFDEQILDYSLDSLLNITGDTIFKDFSIAPITQIDINPGITFFTVNEDLEFENIEAQFTNAKIKAGKVIISAENTIPSRLAFELDIPNATLDGVPLELNDIIPASMKDENGVVIFEIDLAGYELDLTGQSGNDFNLLNVLAGISIPPDGETVTVFNTDLVSLELTYQALEIEYAIGYFGTEHESIEESSDFSILESLSEAIIDLENVLAIMTFSNGFGIDIQAYIFSLEAWNRSNQNHIDLNSNLIGNPINLSRGNFDYVNVIPYEKEYFLDKNNSNIDELVELIPDSLYIQGKVNANPFGNISNFNDFATYESKLNVNLNVEIPLNLSLSNLIISDTVAFQWNLENPEVNEATLFASALNSFPSDVEISLLALDEFGDLIVNLDDYIHPQSSPFVSGKIGDIPGESLLIYSLIPSLIEDLKGAESLVIKASFQTTEYPNKVVFGVNDKLEFSLSADINAKFKIK